MTLSAGARLGPYEILAAIGAGGMGEVYRAKDTRLDRTVAVKVLPERLSSSPEVRQRFEREAKTISQLSHPHICALYDVGNQDGVEYLVMEYLEGETLSERLLKGALPLEQVLRYGTEIVDALDKAHRQGIVHRDLKPGNVMITKSGVKLLDFGLARVLVPESAATQLTAFPTQAAALTQEGAILGTLQYMAPEQLEGKEADARTDVFALGTVLYEMATGRRAFIGASQASLIGSILRDEPRAISEVQPLAPRSLDRIVRTCLAKDPDDRWQTARDVALQLGWVERDRTAEITASLPAVRRTRFARVIPWVLAAIGFALALLALSTSARKSPHREVVQAFLPPPANSFFHFLDANSGPVAVSPDGRRLAFSIVDPEGRVLLWFRDLDAPTAVPIPGTEGAMFPFWSPDSRSLGFFARGRLKVVEASGSPAAPRVLADVNEARGGSWSADGTILFSPTGREGLLRIPAAGGKPVAVTHLGEGEIGHYWPWFLPDGRRFLYRIRYPQTERNAIFLASLDSKERRLLLQVDSDVAYSPSGHLVFRRADRLMAVPFDAGEAQIQGEPVELAQDVERFAATGKTVFAVSENLLAYAPRSQLRLSRLVWFDRTGKELGELGQPAIYVGPTLSPDGRQVAVSLVEQLTNPPDVWIYDAAIRTGTRLTQGKLAELIPVFSPDGRRLVFASNQRGHFDLHEISTAGGQERALLESGKSKWPNDFSPDGRFLLFRELDRETLSDLKVLSLSGERRVRDFAATRFDEVSGDFSPDGHWVAYTSDESGRIEVYVASFPEAGRRYRVSSGGASHPRWSRDGHELFYLVGGKTLTAVPVRPEGPDLAFGPAQPLFDARVQFLVDAFLGPSKYDVSADGRFLIAVRASEEQSPLLVLVLNWAEQLKPRP